MTHTNAAHAHIWAAAGLLLCVTGCDGAGGQRESPVAPIPAAAASAQTLGNHAEDATYGLDLRQYFPEVWGKNNLRTHQGLLHATYSWYNTARMGAEYDHFRKLYRRFFELRTHDGAPLPGELYIFAKKYAAHQCVTTYAHLFFGADKSVTEVGDWFADGDCQPPVALGYRGADGQPAGLSWSAAGGLAYPSRVFHLQVLRQNSAGAAYTFSGSQAWNATRVLLHYDSYTLPYGYNEKGRWRRGAGKTFQDVVRLVFDHGTRRPDHREVICKPDARHPYAAYYYHMPGYNSYTTEFYLAKGVGIIQEAFVFVEDAQYFGMNNCSGLAFDDKPIWTTYHE
jgi:hypothetical protein